MDTEKVDLETVCQKLDNIREALMLVVSALTRSRAREAGFNLEDNKVIVPGYVTVYDVWRNFENNGKLVRLKDWRDFVKDYIVNIAGVDYLPNVLAEAMYQSACENGAIVRDKRK